ncbi:MAG: putative glycolipid-binding domain-containing protein [Ilumatobacteraceae bacterium]
MTSYSPFSSDGHRARWVAWDGDGDEELTLTWENEGWTASGIVSRERVQYVLRLSAAWQVRQLLLFRDLDEPDLWLATDSHGRWGEMNGAHRTDLDGCTDLMLPITPFTATLPIRRLPLLVGHTAEISVVTVDVETLELKPHAQRYTRLDTHRWSVGDADGRVDTFDVDEHGLVLDLPDRFRRSI